MKSVKNGDIVKLGEKVYFVLEDTFIYTGTTAKALDEFVKSFKRKLNKPEDGTTLYTIKSFNPTTNKLNIIKSKKFVKGKGWVYETTGKKDPKLNNPVAGTTILLAVCYSYGHKLDKDGQSFMTYAEVTAIYKGNRWIIKLGPAKVEKNITNK